MKTCVDVHIKECRIEGGDAFNLTTISEHIDSFVAELLGFRSNIWNVKQTYCLLRKHITVYTIYRLITHNCN